jgi:hypothetical protein
LQLKDAPIADTARYEQLRTALDSVLTDEARGDA